MITAAADEEHENHRQGALVAAADAVVDRAAGEVGRHERGGGGQEQRDHRQRRAGAVGAQQGDELAQPAPAAVVATKDEPEVVPARAHSPATSGSAGLRFRKTWSGSPFSAISR